MRYGFEWTPALVLFGMVIILPLAPAFAMIGLLLVAVAAVAAVVTLAGAVVATPYLLARTVRRRLAERHGSTQHPVPMHTAIAGTEVRSVV